MVRLQAHRQSPGQPQGVAEAGDDAALRRRQHQILVAHQLRHGGGHLRREAIGNGGQTGTVGVVGEQPLAEFADRQVRDLGKGGSVVMIDDQACDLVLFVRDDRFVEEVREGQLGQRPAGGHALLFALRGDAGQQVAGARRRSLGQQTA